MKRLEYILKSLLFLALLGLLYYQLFVQNNIVELWASQSWDSMKQNVYYLLAVILIAPINWFLEAKKWQSLINVKANIHLLEALKSIFVGMSFGIISPQRIGEYYGRMLLVNEKRHRPIAVASTLLSSISQNLVTVLVGLSSLYCFFEHFKVLRGIEQISSIWLFAMIAFCTIMYFTIPIWINVLKKIKISLIQKTAESIALWNFRIQFIVLLYAGLRYACYSLQYACLLYFFGAELSLSLVLAGITIIYLVQSGIPLPGGFSILARSSIALFILGSFELNDWTILASTWTLWVINLVLPAFFGLIILRKINVLLIK